MVFKNNLSHKWVHSSVVEHGIADPAVTGSNPVVPYFLVGVVGNISACHADARGSIPRLGVFCFLCKIDIPNFCSITKNKK